MDFLRQGCQDSVSPVAQLCLSLLWFAPTDFRPSRVIRHRD